jgi:hypothetical protein
MLALAGGRRDRLCALGTLTQRAGLERRSLRLSRIARGNGDRKQRDRAEQDAEQEPSGSAAPLAGGDHGRDQADEDPKQQQSHGLTSIALIVRWGGENVEIDESRTPPRRPAPVNKTGTIRRNLGASEGAHGL